MRVPGCRSWLRVTKQLADQRQRETKLSSDSGEAVTQIMDAEVF